MLEWQFTLLLLSNGVLIGLMYALIALGFVLVYKATDAVNFAQGEFVMIAGFVVAGCLGVWGVPLWLAVPLALGSMVAFGFVLERVMLRKLIGRPVIAVVMATIGLASILRGIGPFTIFSGTKPLPLPISDEPFVLGPLFIPPIQLAGGLISLAFLAGFSWFFLKSRNGVAMRAVADNQQVAMAMGIDVERYFGLAWAMTGVVSALGGILWGNMLGVDVNLALVGFKVFPVVILGGLGRGPCSTTQIDSGFRQVSEPRLIAGSDAEPRRYGSHRGHARPHPLSAGFTPGARRFVTAFAETHR